MIVLTLASRLDAADVDAVVRRARVAVHVRTGADPVVTSSQRTLAVIGDAPGWVGTATGVPVIPAAEVRTAGGEAELRTDAVGMTHLYTTSGDGWAAAGDSSAELAVLGERSISPRAVSTLALFGHLIGDRSMFTGVRKCRGGEVLRLSGGRLETGRRAERHPNGERGDRDAAGRLGPHAGASMLRDVVADCLDRHPDAAIELSGGFDSRMVLAAIPSTLRRGRTAITLGGPESADVLIAAQLARRVGLEHRVIDLRPVMDLPIEELVERVHEAAIAVDFADHAPSQAMLTWAEERASQRPRFTGVNGEFARGFYFPGQVAGRTSRRRVDRLARWRLFTNYAVDRTWFAERWIDEAGRSTVDELADIFDGLSADWLTALREYYLVQRVVRWAGPRYSATERASLAPFLSTPFLDWTRSQRPSDCRSNRVMARTLVALDADLAAIPLDSGLAPGDYAGRSLQDRAHRARHGWTRVSRKVGQRLSRSPRPPAVEVALVRRLAAGWRPDVSIPPFDEVLHPDARRRLERGDVPPHAPTVSFLLNVEGAHRYLARARSLLGT